MNSTHCTHRRHPDLAHHHPVVQKVRGRWLWSCDCGGASCRTDLTASNWHHTVVEALRHATTIAA
jgi:hypothetical protein